MPLVERKPGDRIVSFLGVFDEMSRLLVLLCLTLGIVMTGCGGDDKGKEEGGSKKKETAVKTVSLKLPNMT